MILLIGENGKYLRIIDYKSSSKNIDLNEVYAGIQIQLLTYSNVICKDEEIEELIRKNFKMKGLILADVKVIKMNDTTLQSGSSKIVPAGLTVSGDIIEKWTNGVNKEEFKILQDYIDFTIKEISKEIMSGNINLKPYNKNGKTPCEYCSYKSICGFNVKQKDNNYNYLDKQSKDDVILKMKNKIEGKV